MHEYSILGHKKEKYVFLLSLLSIALSTLFSSIITKANNAYHLEIPITISASALFTIVFFSANKIIWKIQVFGIPNLIGKWTCVGKSYEHGSADVLDWSGIVTIYQTWNKIMITMETNDSSSFSTSIIGGIERIEGKGFRLIYLYRNKPSPGNRDLHEHTGLCELLFESDLKSGNGEYFNNKERGSYGSIHLLRRPK
jgi:hypothetical protein